MLSTAWSRIMNAVDAVTPDVGAPLRLDRSYVGPLRVLTRQHGVLRPYDTLSPQADVDAVSRALPDLDADLLLLRAIPAGDPWLQVPAVRRVAHRTQVAWSLDLTAYEDAEAWVASRSKGRRRSLRQGRKALGRYAVECVVDPVQRAAAVERAIELKRAWLEERGTFSRTFSSPSFRADLVAHWAAGGTETPVLALRAGGVLAAIELGTRQGDAYQAYLGAFDPRFDGAGIVATYEAVSQAYRDGCRSYDLLAPQT